MVVIDKKKDFQIVEISEKSQNTTDVVFWQGKVE